jgi:hypothetical protein
MPNSLPDPQIQVLFPHVSKPARSITMTVTTTNESLPEWRVCYGPSSVHRRLHSPA